jgi:hypothetical protein
MEEEKKRRMELGSKSPIHSPFLLIKKILPPFLLPPFPPD